VAQSLNLTFGNCTCELRSRAYVVDFQSRRCSKKTLSNTVLLCPFTGSVSWHQSMGDDAVRLGK